MNTKDQSITLILNGLEKELEAGWVIPQDFWPADHFAFGVVDREHPDRLVYFCTFGKPLGVCDCQFEYIVDLQNPEDYVNVGIYNNVEVGEFLKLVKQFWGRG